jgi:DNA-binding CsgD family transcriptional regulator
MRGGIIGLVEAAYRVEANEEDWLRGIADAAVPHLDDGFGTIAYTYRAVGRLEIGRIVVSGGPVMLSPQALTTQLEATDEEYVQRTWRKLPFGLASELAATKQQQAWKAFDTLGVREIVAVNGVQPDGVGIWLGALRARFGGFDARARKRWARIGAHLGTALRLRRRLARVAPEQVDAADAVLGRGGRIEHAAGEATTKSARDALRNAAIALERSRGPLRRTAPDDALDAWRALVQARWTLVDQFERDGRQYVLARRNDPEVPPVERLSLREKQVVAFVALGHSNKLIAYELGIAASTVGALLWRAAAKLGARSRAELAEIGDVLLKRTPPAGQ